jgi:exo-beta-1,3-glucanase (GH17 family)
MSTNLRISKNNSGESTINQRIKLIFPLPVLLFFLTLLLTINACKPANEKIISKTEVRNSWYYINGERFFIKGIGYEIGARPGQNPGRDTIVDLERMKADLKILKDGGFNTIRTWKQLSEDQLKLVQESGLKVIFGIWLDPGGSYGSEKYMKTSEELVRSVASYSKNYDCVISYLLLNEPATIHIRDSGAKQTVNMLSVMQGILNEAHPGIPVGISGNAAIDDFMDQNFLGFYGINCYDYGDGQAGTMGFTGFLRWCNELNRKQKPMVITEFGYSVSDYGVGKYGGNTLEQQKDGVLANYRGLLDAGAVGACPFYYADGWWKGGNEWVHDNTSEEWFGYWGYSDATDTVGTPRPVWYALVTYIKGIVVSPKNQEVYGSSIPLDLYLDKDVKKVIVKLNDSILYSKTVIKEGFLTDSIQYTPKGMEDAELAFEFFDGQGKIIKTENIYCLLSKQTVTFPSINIEVSPADFLADAKKCTMNISLENPGKFEYTGDLRYNFNYHVWWEFGVQGNISLQGLKQASVYNFEQTSDIPANSPVMVASAGVTVKFGKFTKRLHAQKMVYKDKWYEGLGHLSN